MSRTHIRQLLGIRDFIFIFVISNRQRLRVTVKNNPCTHHLVVESSSTWSSVHLWENHRHGWVAIARWRGWASVINKWMQSKFVECGLQSIDGNSSWLHLGHGKKTWLLGLICVIIKRFIILSRILSFASWCAAAWWVCIVVLVTIILISCERYH